MRRAEWRRRPFQPRHDFDLDLGLPSRTAPTQTDPQSTTTTPGLAQRFSAVRTGSPRRVVSGYKRSRSYGFSLQPSASDRRDLTRCFHMDLQVKASPSSSAESTHSRTWKWSSSPVHRAKRSSRGPNYLPACPAFVMMSSSFSDALRTPSTSRMDVASQLGDWLPNRSVKLATAISASWRRTL